MYACTTTRIVDLLMAAGAALPGAASGRREPAPAAERALLPSAAPVSIAMLLLAGLLAAPVRAEPVTFRIEGVVESVQGDFVGVFSAGDEMTFTYTFESTTPDTFPAIPQIGEYRDSIDAVTLVIGGYAAATADSGRIRIEDENPDYYIVTLDGVAPAPIDLSGATRPDTVLLLRLASLDGSAFADDALPVELDPSDFSLASGQTFFELVSRDLFDGVPSGALIGRVTTMSAPVPLAVGIDVKPGSDRNCVNIDGHGVIPVALLGSEVLDVAYVDVDTLSLGGLALRIRGNRGPMCSEGDVNTDGWPDLVCHFEDDPGFWVAGTDSVTLTGALLDGTRIEGSDAICIVP